MALEKTVNKMSLFYMMNNGTDGQGNIKTLKQTVASNARVKNNISDTGLTAFCNFVDRLSPILSKSIYYAGQDITYELEV